MSPGDDDGVLYPNGLDARTGRPAWPPVWPADLEALALRAAETFQPAEKRAAEEDEEPDRQLRYGVRADDLAATGWAVLVPEEHDPRVLEALAPLLARRREQAGRLYRPPIAVRRGEELDAFFARLDVSPTGSDPEELPYYLLIGASPEEVPFGFEQMLAQGRAVGRLHLGAPADYRAYAENVVAAEERSRTGRPRIAYFAADNGDRATERTLHELVEPLAAKVAERRPDWHRREVLAAEATKPALRGLLGDEAPDLLFSATHGLAQDDGEAGQEERQGALVTSDWPGEDRGVEWGPGCYLAASDLPPALGAAGGVVFLFACYSAGTPGIDDFWFKEPGSPPARLAPRPFVSSLAQGLLSRPGGPGAVVGHVDRAWTCSFSWHRGGQTGAFEDVLFSLMDGDPVGHAADWLGSLHREAAARHLELVGRRETRQPFDSDLLVRTWLAAHDARNFVVCGDPAVRLPVD